jgi:hypothetical protein
MDNKTLRKMVETIVADTVWMIRDDYFIYEYKPTLDTYEDSNNNLNVYIEPQDKATINETHIVDEIMGNLE